VNQIATRTNQLAEIAGRISQTHRRVIEAGVITEVNQMVRDVSIVDLGQYIVLLMNDVGYQPKDSDKVEQVYLCQFIQTYYNDLTLSELKVAFEMLVLGELDRYLPTSNGQPHRGHYQKFNKEYVARVLGAFRKHKRQVRAIVQPLLLQSSYEISESEKQELGNKWLKFLCETIKMFMEGDWRREYVIDNFTWAYLKKIDCVPDVQPTDEDREKVLLGAQTGAYNYISKSMYIQMQTAYQSGTVNSSLEEMALFRVRKKWLVQNLKKKGTQIIKRINESR